MTLPPGVIISKSNQVCKLVKYLYGLKQAIRNWHERLNSFLIQYEYKQAAADVSFFIKQTKTSFTIMFIYVDVILAGNSLQEMH